jgi:sterol desaturase/sphingolipid hydroxylase (fatty acid hydroxylase superfamily)
MRLSRHEATILQVLTLSIAFVTVACIFYSIEAVWPAQKSKPIWRRDGWLDLGYWFMTSLVSKSISKAAVIVTIGILLLVMGRRLSPESVMVVSPLLAGQPTWMIALEMLFFGDLIAYWQHRAFHNGRLWPFHAIHHSSRELDWLSSVRLHPLNVVIGRSLQVIPFVLLGFPLGLLAAYVPFLTFYAIFIHANVGWSFGPLRYIIATPRFHRWHHTSEAEGLDKNFAGMFPIWDIVFGTFYMPEGKVPTQFGVHGEEIPEGFIGQMVYPFKRQGELTKAS